MRQIRTWRSSPSSDVAGLYIVKSVDSRRFFVFGHPEYDSDTLRLEYERDVKRGIDPDVPVNYFPNDDPSREPLNIWNSQAQLLYTNWLGTTCTRPRPTTSSAWASRGTCLRSASLCSSFRGKSVSGAIVFRRNRSLTTGNSGTAACQKRPPLALKSQNRPSVACFTVILKKARGSYLRFTKTTFSGIGKMAAIGGRFWQGKLPSEVVFGFSAPSEADFV